MGHTSGAIHLYVPVSAVITPVCAFTLATPKSATLTTCKIKTFRSSKFHNTTIVGLRKWNARQHTH